MPVLSDQQIANVAKASGWATTADITKAVAIALAESGGRTDAVNHNFNGTYDYGIWQVNSVHGFPVSELLTPTGNGRAAYTVYRQQGWRAWSAYNNGSYLAFLPRARAVAGSASGGGSVENAPTHTDWPNIPGTDVLSSVKAFFDWITDPHNWQRVGMFILGGILLIIGLFKLTGDNKLSTATKSAIGVATRVKVA